MRALVSAVLLAAAGCSYHPPLPPGDDGGQADGGQADGGRDGGAQDAGFVDDQCGGALGGCDAGSSCMRVQLEDGGRGRRCAAGGCDLVLQDCPGGSKCDYRDGGRACVADGTLAEGALCANLSSACIKGTVCAAVPQADAGLESRCTKYCFESAHCTAPQQCLLNLVLADTNERPQICADPPPTCDLLTQTCPTPTDGCYPGGGTGTCFAAGSAGPAQSCVYSNDCQKGSTCVNTAGGATCRQLCAHPTGAPGCDAGTCTRLTGTTGVGVCI